MKTRCTILLGNPSEETFLTKSEENYSLYVCCTLRLPSPPELYSSLPHYLEVACCCLQSLIAIQVLGFGDMPLKDSSVEEHTTAFVHGRHHGCTRREGEGRAGHHFMLCRAPPSTVVQATRLHRGRHTLHGAGGKHCLVHSGACVCHNLYTSWNRCYREGASMSKFTK